MTWLEAAMMGRQTGDQASLFYEFRLDNRIPKDHLLRRINLFVGPILDGVCDQLKPYYSEIGRPSVDPELMIRMLIVGYCFGLRSERSLPPARYGTLLFSAPQNHSRSEFAARFKAERARQQQRYCTAFGLWRDCTNRRCRRDCACRGDAHACLKRAFGVVLHRTQWQARQDILEATPKNIGAPEREARLCMPRDFYVETTAQAVASYLARFKTKPKALPRGGKSG
jgi:hypothetical protein